MEGTRPVLVEIQCLLAPNPGGPPRRSVVGWDAGRLAMLLAVLETRCGLRLNASDVYLNIAGGLRIAEPAADLAVAPRWFPPPTDRPTDPGMVFFGEVGLSGEVRQVAQAELRLKEAQKLGFGSRLPAPPGRPRQPAAVRPGGPRAAGDRASRRSGGQICGKPGKPPLDGLASGRRPTIYPPCTCGSRILNWVDIIVLAVIAVSAVLAFMRGFVREVMGIGAWVGRGLRRGLGGAGSGAAHAAHGPAIADWSARVAYGARLPRRADPAVDRRRR